MASDKIAQSLIKIQNKWQKAWEKNKAFQPEINKKTKFMTTFPYPYVNGLPHIGHLFSIMRSEVAARYKRHQGFNVLFPQGWHATGSPIVNAAKRIKEKEPKQIKILKDLRIPDKDLKKFENPKHWPKYFCKEYKKDLQAMGLSIDWRREFVTTELNPHYDKFIQWQFNTLKKKGYVIKGKFPVVWCPKDNCAVSDHARVEGEGETPKDFIWIKFKLKDSDLILMAGTTRPDALLAQTHLWIDPDATYHIVEVEKEKWVVGKEALEKIEEQFGKPKIVGEITSDELMGKWVKGPLVDYDIYIVPAWFIDANVGSGIVYSALEDPVDLIEIQDIQKDLARLKKYHLDLEVIKKLKPFSIIKVPGLGDNLGQEMIDKYKIVSAQEKHKVKQAKDDLNKTIYRKGVMKKNCGKYAGMSVEKAQALIKKDLIKAKDGVMFYELTGRVVCRCLTEAIVKVVEDQWFLDYGNEKWKKLVHKNLKQLKLYPEKARAQFEYVVDWLHQWACTREEGLGTRLPWDKQWLIESLSDSTIYNAYYTFNHLLEKIPIKKIDDAFFDYLLLGKGKKPAIKNIEKMKQEFNYWYPTDFRNSGKDLIQNHLTFYLFNHTAIFPEKFWPKGIGVNGWVTVDGNKMSKSLGNMIPVRDMATKFSADASRITILYGGESLDDPNWDTNFAKSVVTKLEQFTVYCQKNYNKGRTGSLKAIDKWALSKLNQLIKESTEEMEQTMFRSAIQKIFFDTQQMVRWYKRRTHDDRHKDVMKKIIEAQVIMVSPFIPHLCEEIWERLGKNKTGKDFVSFASWPKVDKKSLDSEADQGEILIEQTLSDLQSVMKLAKVEKPKKIMFFVSPLWKYKFYEKLAKAMKKTRHPGELMKAMMKTDLKKHGKVITKMIPKLARVGLPSLILSQKKEQQTLTTAKDFFQTLYKCEIEVIAAEKSKENKAQQASPGKVAILVE